jgi:hypothetical protein
MNIALWIVQGLLAAAFLMAGGMKLAKPHGELPVGAAVLHARRSETPMIVRNAVLFALAAFMAWGRFGDYPL